MRISVGSINKNKIEAVKDVILQYPRLKDAGVIGVSVKSEIADQPWSEQEVLKGAMNRAKNAFKDCDLSIGLESGLRYIEGVGYVNVEFCAIFDGIRFSIGTSGQFAIPTAVVKKMKERGIDMSIACKEVGLTNHQYVGHDIGIIGILTKEIHPRKKYTEPAIHMALASFLNPELYSNPTKEKE